MFALFSKLFGFQKTSTCEPRPRPPRYRVKRDASRPSAPLDVPAWQPPIPVDREALLRGRPRLP
jgi:hypothetical protein